MVTCTIEGDSAVANGGGIYNSGAIGPINNCKVDFDSTTTYSGFLGNGGGICNRGANLRIYSSSEINHDTAGGSGGGIFNIQGNITIGSGQVSDDCQVSYDRASNAGAMHGYSFDQRSQGGGIANRAVGNTVTLQNTSVDHDISYGDGGGIFNNEGDTLTIIGGEVRNDTTGELGGGIKTDGHATISGDCIISGNLADDSLLNVGRGGGIVNGPNDYLNISNCVISDNIALEDGGGIESRLGATAVLINDTIGGNTVIGGDGFTNLAGLKEGGGGVRSIGASITLTGCNISGNEVSPSVSETTTPYAGGGVYLSIGTVILSGDTITGNSVGHTVGGSTRYGGGVCILSGSDTLTSCTISNDTVVGGNGGGLYSANATATVTLCTIDGDSAVNGGGVDVVSGGIVMTGTTIANDAATGNGGGISNNTTSTLTACTISGDSTGGAGLGGGVYNGPSATLILINSTIANDTAYKGGGIEDENALTCTNCTISGDLATENSQNDLNSAGGLDIQDNGSTSGNNVSLYNTIIAGNLRQTVGGESTVGCDEER